MRWVNIGVIVALVDGDCDLRASEPRERHDVLSRLQDQRAARCRRRCSLPPGYGYRRKRVGADALGLAGAKGNIGILT